MALEYSIPRPPRWYQRKAFQRGLWALMAVCLTPVVVILFVLAWDAAVEAWQASRSRALLAGCMEYSPPPEQVVFEMEAGVVARSVTAAPWVRWWSFDPKRPTVFMHRRDDSKPVVPRPDQLVVVQLESQLRNTYDGRTILDQPLLCFDSCRVYPGSTTTGLSTGVVGSNKLVILPQASDRVRVFAGRSDTGDAARFSFDIEYNGVRQTVRGRLSQNVVTLAPESGVTLEPPGWRHATFWVPAGATATQSQATAAAAASSGEPSPQIWPRTPFGQPFRPAATRAAVPATRKDGSNEAP